METMLAKLKAAILDGKTDIIIGTHGENIALHANLSHQIGDEYYFDCTLMESLSDKFQQKVQAIFKGEFTDVYLPSDDHTIRFQIHFKWARCI